MTASQTAIRLIDVKDAARLSEHLTRDADAFARWTPDREPDFYTAYGQRQNIEGLLGAFEDGMLWPGVITTDDQVIGQVWVNNILRGPLCKAFISYWVASTCQGQGHATEAVAQLVRLMADELGLHRAEAFTQLENVRSHTVLRRNGFVPYGIAHSHIFIAGQWRDEIFWELSLDGVS